SVQIAGEVEQEDLQEHRAGVEHRSPAEACDAIVTFVADADADRVDALTQSASRVEAEVRRRIAELAPALIAVHDRANDEPGETEQSRGLFDLSRRQSRADGARGDATVVISHGRNDGRRKAALAPLFREKVRRADAPLAEAEIKSDDDAGHPVAVHQNAFDE